MAKDAVATMGEILPDDVGGRDAVHVAVISAEAARPLNPGANVGRSKQSTPDRLIVGLPGQANDEPIGIVDPFLKDTVLKGQRFWLYLYPRTITSLSHNWTHPAFADVKPREMYVNPSGMLVSEQWLRDYADEIGDDYDSLMGGADAWANSRGRFDEYYYGPDQGGYHGLFEGVSTHPDFWDHYERVRGVKIGQDKRQSFFTCSC